MIEFVRGNLFESSAEALVNTVNCVGIMGKGIAYQFRRAYPNMHADYVARCKRGDVRLGQVYGYKEGGKLIVNFPTKQHWKSNSRLPDIASGLQSLRELIEAERIASIALPPLGCGNGGLDWREVKPVIEEALWGIEGVAIQVFEPAGNFDSTVAKEPKVSLGHFVLAALRAGLDHPSKLGLQKAAYFFNVFTFSDYFQFTEYRYGPYAPAIEPMSAAIKDYLDARGIDAAGMVQDGLARRLAGQDADRLQRWGPAIRKAVELCNRRTPVLEAIATAHAVLARSGPSRLEDLRQKFLSWSPEKGARYSESDVDRALETLVAEGLATRTLIGYAPIEAQVTDAALRVSISEDLRVALAEHALSTNRQVSEVVDGAIRFYLRQVGALSGRP